MCQIKLKGRGVDTLVAEWTLIFIKQKTRLYKNKLFNDVFLQDVLCYYDYTL